MKISKDLRDSRKLAQAMEDIRQVILYAWQEALAKQLHDLMPHEKEMTESESRHKHNQHTKSTWKINWDTRKHCQVMNNRPVHIVRKVKI